MCYLRGIPVIVHEYQLAMIYQLPKQKVAHLFKFLFCNQNQNQRHIEGLWKPLNNAATGGANYGSIMARPVSVDPTHLQSRRQTPRRNQTRHRLLRQKRHRFLPPLPNPQRGQPLPHGRAGR